MRGEHAGEDPRAAARQGLRRFGAAAQLCAARDGEAGEGPCGGGATRKRRRRKSLGEQGPAPLKSDSVRKEHPCLSWYC